MSTLDGEFVTDSKGNRTAVIVPIETYNRILEDIEDLAVIAERREEPTISLEELERRLRADGLIQG